MSEHIMRQIIEKDHADTKRERLDAAARQKRIDDSKAASDAKRQARDEPLRAKYAHPFSLVLGSQGIIDEKTYRETRRLLKELRKEGPYAMGFVNERIALSGGISELLKRLSYHAALYD